MIKCVKLGVMVELEGVVVREYAYCLACMLPSVKARRHIYSLVELNNPSRAGCIRTIKLEINMYCVGYIQHHV